MVKIICRNEGPMSLASKNRPDVEREFETRKAEKLWHSGRRNGGLILSRIDLESEVHAYRADRRGISQAKTNRVRKIIKVCSGRRFPGQGYVVHIAIHVATIVKNRATQTVADIGQLHWKAQFLVEDQKRESANGEAGAGVARAGFIQSETPKGGCAARKKALG